MSQKHHNAIKSRIRYFPPENTSSVPVDYQSNKNGFNFPMSLSQKPFSS